MTTGLKLALLGYGRMGRVVEDVAGDRGHEVTARWDGGGDPSELAEALAGADVAVDFTVPGAVAGNAEVVAASGVDLVVGTTGWLGDLDRVREAVEEAGTGLVHGPNFSLGIQLFFRLVREAARLAEELPEYDVTVSEVHHRHKVDHPSGTAHRLADILLEELSRKDGWTSLLPQGAVDPEILQVSSVRSGENPGAHDVVWEGPHDRIVLSHQARGRQAFAAGAVQAAEWIHGRAGVFTVDDMLDERFGASRGTRER